MFLLPVIPFITDTSSLIKLIKDSVRKASQVGVDFIIFGGMTLKDGRQKDYFYNTLGKTYPQLIPQYQSVYSGRKWGEATKGYYNSIHQTFYEVAKEYKIPVRMPSSLYRDILKENDLVIVMLEHLVYLLKLQGKKSPYGWAAYSISKLKESLFSLKGKLQEIRGVGQRTEGIILEVLETKKSSYLEKLLAFGS